jgi:hypothetical protein
VEQAKSWLREWAGISLLAGQKTGTVEQNLSSISAERGSKPRIAFASVLCRNRTRPGCRRFPGVNSQAHAVKRVRSRPFGRK